MTPAKPLPLLTAVTSTQLAGGEQVDLDLLADLVAADVVEAQLDELRRPGSTPALAKWPASGLVSLRGVLRGRR